MSNWRASVGACHRVRSYRQPRIVEGEPDSGKPESGSARNEHNVSLVRRDPLGAREREALRRFRPRGGHEAGEDSVGIHCREI